MRPISVADAPAQRASSPRRSDASPRPQTIVVDESVVLASLSIRVAVLDAGGCVVLVNEAWRSAAAEGSVGENRANIGQNYLDECRRAEARGFESARELCRGVEAVLSRRTRTFRAELASEGNNRWFEVAVDAMTHDAGGAVVSIVDVTERRREERSAETIRRRMAHLGRISIMREIASALAGEIKQPMTAIRLNALAGATLLGAPQTGLDDVWSDTREAWQMFKDIYDDASRASAVIEHVHQHVCSQGGRGGAVDIAETCRVAAALIEHEAAIRGARIEFAFEIGTPAIVGDAIEIQQIVMSLLLNALDAVSASPERVITLGTVAHGTEVELYVRDTGPGLSPKVRQHLFESFFTTKEGSLGMGLIVVRSIVERRRGRISAEEAPEGGALFRVHLPVS